MTQPTSLFPHAEMMVEWLKDTSQEIECRLGSNGEWIPIYFSWNPDMEYRFKLKEST